MRTKVTRQLVAALVSLLALSACSGQSELASVVRNGPELTAVAQQQQVSVEPTNEDFVLIWKVFGTPTPRPTLNPSDSATATAFTKNRPTDDPSGVKVAGNVPTEQLLPPDPDRGQLVFQGPGTCFTCHDTTNNITVVGPSLIGVGTRAGNRIPGKTADQYLHESILNPTAYVVEGFAPLMPQNFGTSLTQQQIEDLVAYLKTLK